MDPEGGRVELWEPPRIVKEHPPHVGSVTGLGGVFFKSDDPAVLKAWYADRLGVNPDPEGYVTFPCREMDGRSTFTAWEAFPSDTDYFNPSDRPFMLNFRVRDLGGLLERLRASGVDVDSQVDEYEFGRFGWIMDPEGHRIELWEPPA
jgi:predicted enzyme related to lactoylglutathione lyase